MEFTARSSIPQFCQFLRDYLVTSAAHKFGEESLYEHMFIEVHIGEPPFPVGSNNENPIHIYIGVRLRRFSSGWTATTIVVGGGPCTGKDPRLML